MNNRIDAFNELNINSSSNDIKKHIHNMINEANNQSINYIKLNV